MKLWCLTLALNHQLFEWKIMSEQVSIYSKWLFRVLKKENWTFFAPIQLGKQATRISTRRRAQMEPEAVATLPHAQMVHGRTVRPYANGAWGSPWGAKYCIFLSFSIVLPYGAWILHFELSSKSFLKSLTSTFILYVMSCFIDLHDFSLQNTYRVAWFGIKWITTTRVKLIQYVP